MTKPTHERGRHTAEAFVHDWLETAGTRLGLGFTAEIARGRNDVQVTIRADGRGFGPRRPVQVAGALQTLLEAAAARQGLRESVEVRAAEVGADETTEEHGLTAAVRAAAVKAARQGRAFALGPLSVVDRRQVHQALGELGQLWTQSEGEGIFRRLWIVPRALLPVRHPPASPAPSVPPAPPEPEPEPEDAPQG